MTRVELMERLVSGRRKEQAQKQSIINREARPLMCGPYSEGPKKKQEDANPDDGRGMYSSPKLALAQVPDGWMAGTI